MGRKKAAKAYSSPYSVSVSMSMIPKDDEVFEVEKILASRKIKNTRWYRGKWLNYNQKTWEPDTNLTGILIREIHINRTLCEIHINRTQQGRKRRHPKRRRSLFVSGCISPFFTWVCTN